MFIGQNIHNAMGGTNDTKAGQNGARSTTYGSTVATIGTTTGQNFRFSNNLHSLCKVIS